MTTPCTARETVPAYVTGCLNEDDLLRPGGTELTARAVGFCCLTPGAQMLDLGCGSGVSLRFLREKEFKTVGIDIAFPIRAIALPVAQAEATHWMRCSRNAACR